MIIASKELMIRIVLLPETVSDLASKKSWPDTWNRIQVVKPKNR
jgi:hypothetical protein